MIEYRNTLICNFKTFASALCTLALIGVLLTVQAQQPDSTNLSPGQKTSSSASGEWQSAETVHLIGLAAIKEKEKGSLSISPDALTLVSRERRASVQRAEIFNVSVCDLSLETGGTAGKITRAMVPFGGGLALATVTHKQIGLLTGPVGFSLGQPGSSSIFRYKTLAGTLPSIRSFRPLSAATPTASILPTRLLKH